jgi:hypothetical protein
MEQSVHFSSGFLHLDIMLNEQLFAYYLSCQTIGKDKYLITLYMLENYDEALNSLVGETVF